MTFTDEEKEIITKLYSEHHGAPYIAKQLNVKEGRVSWYIKRNIGTRSCSEAARKYNCDEKFFDTIDTEEKAYWLGFLYADGYVSSANAYSHYIGLSISNKDHNHLEKFKTSLKANHPIHTYKVSNGYNPNSEYCRLLIASKQLYSDAIKQGILEHKTDILKPPNIEESLVKHFIRGYFDGDGCIAHNTKRNDYTIKILGTKELLDFIKQFVEDNNIAKINRYYKRHSDDIVQCLEIGGNFQALKFCDIIYSDSTIWLDRKHERYISLKKLVASRAVLKKTA